MEKCFWNVVALLVLSTISVGCQGFLGSIRGPVPEGSRIVLSSGNGTSGRWQSQDITVTYWYVRSGNSLDLNGQVSLARKVVGNFPFIDFFHLHAYLLDSAGNVLGGKAVMSSGSNTFVEREYIFPFQTTIELPPGTSSMAFTYTGRASEPGRMSMATYDFFGGP